MNTFLKYINNTNYEKILLNINNVNDFYKFVENFQLNLNSLNELKIEYLLKIVFNKIIFFDGKIENINFNILYEKIKKKNTNFKFLNNFITLFDDYILVKDKFQQITLNIIKIFKKDIPSLNKFDIVNNFDMKNIENVKILIDTQVYDYYNSFFEIKYNKYFFKRIIDSRNVNNQKINSEEMLDRLIKLVKIFKLVTLQKLNIEIITVKDFLYFDYNKKVEYFRTFYNRTHVVFRFYFKIYKKYFELHDHINSIIKIDELEYVDNFNDSSSSSFYSEFEIKSDDNVLNVHFSDLSISEYNPDDDNDTPNNKNTSEYNNIKCIDDNDTSINDLFVKN
tara:strand:- start:2261 stop:3268 length:1008 start_codon:yes stop_codon:yes gene_type:complete